jgi:predicted TIM-barrel fold metal-dependent hydrolase
VFVAACDLAAPDVRDTLEQHGALAGFRGIRQILGRHPEEDRKHGSDALLDNPAFLAGLRELSAMGASFDLQMIPPQMDRVIALLKQLPELPVALCHCGSPWDQSPAGLASWRAGLAGLAELPQVVCKVSGLGMFNPDWRPQDLRPIILAVIDTFGPERVMFGSNFPVDKLYNSYEALWDAYHAACAGFSDTERRQLFYRTAADFYRID